MLIVNHLVIWIEIIITKVYKFRNDDRIIILINFDINNFTFYSIIYYFKKQIKNKVFFGISMYYFYFLHRIFISIVKL